MLEIRTVTIVPDAENFERFSVEDMLKSIADECDATITYAVEDVTHLNMPKQLLFNLAVEVLKSDDVGIRIASSRFLLAMFRRYGLQHVEKVAAKETDADAISIFKGMLSRFL